jgi:DNA-binding MarR family transcriptional regulator
MISKQILTSIPRAIRTIRMLSKKSVGTTLPLQQLRVLFLIKDGLGQTHIADALSVSMPAVSKIINLLVEKDYVSRQTCEDRRCLKLSLTSKGAKVMNQVSKKIEAQFESGLTSLTKIEKTDLERGLKILDKLMLEVSGV